jgi:hypothetical protein
MGGWVSGLSRLRGAAAGLALRLALQDLTPCLTTQRAPQPVLEEHPSPCLRGRGVEPSHTCHSMEPQPGCMKNSARVMVPTLLVHTEKVPTALWVSGVHDSPLLAIMVRLRGALALREEGRTLQPDLRASGCVSWGWPVGVAGSHHDVGVLCWCNRHEQPASPAVSIRGHLIDISRHSEGVGKAH